MPQSVSSYSSVHVRFSYKDRTVSQAVIDLIDKITGSKLVGESQSRKNPQIILSFIHDDDEECAIQLDNLLRLLPNCSAEIVLEIKPSQLTRQLIDCANRNNAICSVELHASEIEKKSFDELVPLMASVKKPYLRVFADVAMQSPLQIEVNSEGTPWIFDWRKVFSASDIKSVPQLTQWEAVIEGVITSLEEKIFQKDAYDSCEGKILADPLSFLGKGVLDFSGAYLWRDFGSMLFTDAEGFLCLGRDMPSLIEITPELLKNQEALQGAINDMEGRLERLTNRARRNEAIDRIQAILYALFDRVYEKHYVPIDL